MLKIRTKCLLAAVLALVPFGAVRADTISLTTGIANWQLSSVVNLGGYSLGSVLGEVAVNGPAATIGSGNPAWLSTPVIVAADTFPSDGHAVQWISASSNGATLGVWGWYTYTLTITPTLGGLYGISGEYSSDNMVDSFKVDGNELVTGTPSGSPSAIYGFNSEYIVAATANSPITLTVQVYNESTSTPPQGSPEINKNVTYLAGPSDPNGDINPTGFIMEGFVTYIGPSTNITVPLPASVLSGAALCAILGGVKLAKRRTLA